MASLTAPFTESLGQLTAEACRIAESAGDICMDYYNASATDSSILQTEMKEADSPVTAADYASSRHIVSELTKVTPGITVVSEENDECPDPSETYWTVDPLDGTKLFTNRIGGFAVNIALVINGNPVLGVVRCPTFGITYFAYEGSGAYKQEADRIARPIRTRRIFEKGDLKTFFDAHHANPDTYNRARCLLESRMVQLPCPDTTRILPHNLMVAEGQFDLHVKTGKDITFKACSGRSWDNAADYRILSEAGGTMAYLVQGGTETQPELAVHLKPMTFDIVRDRMPAYIAIGDKDWAAKNFPELGL